MSTKNDNFDGKVIEVLKNYISILSINIQEDNIYNINIQFQRDIDIKSREDTYLYSYITSIIDSLAFTDCCWTNKLFSKCFKYNDIEGARLLYNKLNNDKYEYKHEWFWDAMEKEEKRNFKAWFRSNIDKYAFEDEYD